MATKADAATGVRARGDAGPGGTGKGGAGKGGAGTGDATKGEQTRLAILDAAIGRFGRDGFRATSVADIARDAAVSGTLAYAYFKNKEALFLDALDSDAAAVISEGVLSVIGGDDPAEWKAGLILTLLDSLDRHPLASRVLAGREPDVTDRVIELPAVEELREAVAARIERDQAGGMVRADIDARAVGSGIVTMVMAMVMAVQQFGRDVVPRLGPDVWSVFGAALDPHAPHAGEPEGG